MKIIFSRKGFDKSAGGVASPIYPDGGLCSLPIPAEWDEKQPPTPRHRVRYKDLSYDAVNLGSLVEDLSFNPRSGRPRIKATSFCHLDPDLIQGDLARKAGWLPIFGQSRAAAAHLLNHGVRKGDLFLFFGWFRRLRGGERPFRFDAGKQDAHVIFGWLQIGEIWCEFKRESVVPKWARYHPHVRGKGQEFNNLSEPENVVFIAKRRLGIPGISRRLPGSGVFQMFHTDLCLSRLDERRGHWRVPRWMYPFPHRLPLTYHGDRNKWKKSGKWAFLQTVGRGQEFILDLDSPGYPEKYPVDRANEWLGRLFQHAR